MSERIRIVGGGLTGILAAFEAHRLGWRDIELHERFDALGGVARPRLAHGRELRDGCIYFGGPGDPIVETLSAHGARFETFANRFGSVSRDRDGYDLFTPDFGGPAVDTAATALARPQGPSIADRLDAYPSEARELLHRYCQWHLDADLETLDAGAVTPLAINRIFPAGADLPLLAASKKHHPQVDEYYGIPRNLWGRQANLTASLPVGGFAALFETCHRALEGLGVTLAFNSLISPRQALAEAGPNDTLVWAANPTTLFKPVGLTPPKLLRKTFSSYVYRVAFDGPCPAYVQNFTATGAAFRVYVYESGGDTLAVAECVREADPLALKDEMRVLMAGLGDLRVGELLNVAMEPRWIYHTLDAIEGLAALRGRMRTLLGDAFVPGAWEPYAKAEKLIQVNTALAAARTGEAGRAQAAG